MLSNKVLVAFAVLATIALVKGFSPATPSPHRLASSTSLQMGLFDSLSEAFSNEEYSAPPEGIKASARHILVKEPYQVELVMDKLKAGEGFANVAREMSTCPSGSSGGSLGSFGPGTMIQAFDEVIFDKETPLGEVVGPVQKQFGYHLIVVDKRTGV